MISYAPFRAEHIGQLNLQDIHKWVYAYTGMEGLRSLEKTGFSGTILKDGVPTMCVGVVEAWPGRGLAWAFVGVDLHPLEFRQAHHIVKAALGLMPYKRLEMYVDVDFENGHRWAKALGFTVECERMRAFQMNGHDCAMYVRIHT